MKRQIKRLVCYSLISMIAMSILQMPVMASTHKQNIFPSYTGLKARAKGNELTLNSYPSTYSQVKTEVESDTFYVLGSNNNWYRIRSGEKEGWVPKESLQIKDEAFVPYSKVLGEEIVEFGKLFIGTPYVWGGNDLQKGVDCSGLTKKVFEGFDIHISRVSRSQVNDGVRVKKSELRPGDLVFFDTSGVNTGKISHVGIYAGDGQFLHADCTRGVTLSRLSSNYYTKNYVTSSRIINEV